MSTKANKHFTTTITLFCFINQQRISNIARLKGYHLLVGKPLNLEVHICMSFLFFGNLAFKFFLYSQKRENEGQCVNIRNFRSDALFLDLSNAINPIYYTDFI